MATLASYCLGDTVVQWTLIISLMLCAMGVGSAFSCRYRSHLLTTYVFVELGLAALTALSVIVIYALFSVTEHLGFFIYLLAFTIGLLVGMELPLATRINAKDENLRTNVGNMLSKDYLGALFGGVFFAFIALPHIGLPMSAALVGTLNFVTVIVLAGVSFQKLSRVRLCVGLACLCALALVFAFVFGQDVVIFSEQQRYRDKIVLQQRSKYQKIVLTNFRQDYWLYLNANQQFSTVDEHRYHEVFVHPALAMVQNAKDVLILGGGDGLAAREILKHQQVRAVTIVDIDEQVTELARTNSLLQKFNANALSDPRVRVFNRDAFVFLRQQQGMYDVVFADFPDPKSIDLARLYSLQFLRTALMRLREDGIYVTQAGSPTYGKQAFLSILKTALATGYPAVPLHTFMPTMGDWGWVLMAKSAHLSSAQLRNALETQELPQRVPLRYLNADIQRHMLTGWGKEFYTHFSAIKVNTLNNLSLYQYYRDDRWDLY